MASELPSGGNWALTDGYDKYAGHDTAGNVCVTEWARYGASIYADLNAGCKNDRATICGYAFHGDWRDEKVVAGACQGYNGTQIVRLENSAGCCTVKTWYRDSDGDGYGTSDTKRSCDRPSGYTSRDGDCDDRDPTVHSKKTIQETCEWECGTLPPYNTPLYYQWNGHCVPFVLQLEMSKSEWVTDRPGNDYRRVANQPRMSVEDCRSLCGADKYECAAWTYLIAGVQGSNPVCYLKNKWGQPRKMVGAFSGVTMIAPEYNPRSSEPIDREATIT